MSDVISTANAAYEYYWRHTKDAEIVSVFLAAFKLYCKAWMSGWGVQVGPPYSDQLDQLVQKRWLKKIPGEFVSVYWLTQRGSHVLGVGAWWGK